MNDVYTNLMGSLLTQISSNAYITSYKIPYNKFNVYVEYDENGVVIFSNWGPWEDFKKDFNKDPSKYKPGLYSEIFYNLDEKKQGNDPYTIGAHFFGLNDDYIMANGYTNAGDFKHGRGLGFQEDLGHGFCQTFAIMWLLIKDADKQSINIDPVVPISPSIFKSWHKNFWKKLKSSVDNIKIFEENGKLALQFLGEFTKHCKWVWEFNTLMRQIEGQDIYYDKDLMEKTLNEIGKKHTKLSLENNSLAELKEICTLNDISCNKKKKSDLIKHMLSSPKLKKMINLNDLANWLNINADKYYSDESSTTLFQDWFHD